MSSKLASLISFLIFVNFSCKYQNKNLTSFTGPFPKRAINFTNVAGDSIEFEQVRYLESKATLSDKNILCFDSIMDTMVCKIFFDDKTRFNLILDQHGDTIFHGLISRFRGLFFCSTKINDTSWHIGAFKMKHGYFEGLINIQDQSWFVHHYIDNHRDNKMIVLADTFTPSYRLKPDKKEILPIFKSYLTNEIKYRIIDRNSNPEMLQLLEKPSKADLLKGFQIVEDSLIADFYPNPAIDFVHIEFFAPGEYLAHFIHICGKRLKKVTLHNISEKISISDLTPGLYIVKIYSETSNCFETKKLIVKR